MKLLRLRLHRHHVPGLVRSLCLAALVGVTSFSSAQESLARSALVPLVDRHWGEQITDALYEMHRGDVAVGLAVLQRGLDLEANVLVEVPFALDVPAPALRESFARHYRSFLLETEKGANGAAADDGAGAARGDRNAAGRDPRFRRGARTPDERRYLNVPDVCRVVLSRQPASVLDVYRTRYQEAAERLLASSIDAIGPSPALWGEVATRYPFTASGIEARELLADSLFEAGHCRPAAVHYEALLQIAGKPTVAARLWWKRLVCLRRLGNKARYREARVAFLAAGASVTSRLPAWPGRPADDDGIEAALDFLERRVPLQDPESRPPPLRASRWGGELDAGRLPSLPGSRLELSWVSWMWAENGLDLENHDEIRRLDRAFPRTRFRAYVPRVGYPIHPLATGTEVWISGVFQLYRLDGAPGGGKVLADIPKPSPLTLVRSFTERSGSSLYSVTMWERERETGVASLADLPDRVAITPYIGALVDFEHFVGYVVTAEIPIRSLVAYDASSGEPMWRTLPVGEPRVAGAKPAPTAGNRGRPQRPGERTSRANRNRLDFRRPLRDALAPHEIPAEISFSSPALVRDGLVVASGWRQEGAVIGLVRGLDLRTGRKVWETMLCGAGLEQTLFGELAREPLASFVVERDGIVYCLTNLGVVAALDLASGDVKWITPYETIAVEPTNSRDPRMRTLPWSANPPLFLDHLLVVTPRDSRFLYAIDTGSGPGGDAEAGKIVWRYDNGNLDLRDLLGYHDGHLYFTGNAGVVALDISSDDGRGVLDGGGQPRRRVSGLRWQRGSIPGSGVLTATGVVYADALNLWSVDLALTRRQPLLEAGLPATRHGEFPGNLQIAGDVVLMTSNSLVSAFQALVEPAVPPAAPPPDEPQDAARDGGDR